LKETIQWELEQAQQDTGINLGRGLARQSAFYEEIAQFFHRYDYFVLPVTQVAPFDVTIPYPTQINGVRMRTYVDWMRSCWYVSFMATPAISVPAGFTTNGLPIGLQIVGRHRGDLSVLQLAYAFEQATQFGERAPLFRS
jgi:amidase